MTPRSNCLGIAWEIPWTEEPGGLQPMGSQRVGQDYVILLRGKRSFLAREEHDHMLRIGIKGDN